MKLVPVAACALCASFAAAAAHAGTVYVPLPGLTSVGASTFETQVLIANESGQRRVTDALLIPAGAAGTDRDGLTGARIAVNARRMSIFRPTAGVAGLLELDGSADLRYTGRLLGAASDALGIELPVVTSANASAAGISTTVAGFRTTAGGTRTGHLGIVNLGSAAAECTVDVRRTGGSAFVAGAEIGLAPLSHSAFQVGIASDLVDARAIVRCDQPFYAWGWNVDSVSGELATLLPAGSGASTLAPPGETAGCDPTAVCYERLGLVHQPTKSVPVGRVSFTPEPMTAKRLRLTMDVTVDQFFAGDPDAKHLIYWFVINNNKDMPGMLFFRGPAAYTALVRHGIGLTHPQKKKLVDKNFTAEPGATYRVVNDYDMGAGVYRVTITNLGSGDVESTLVGTPNVNKVELDASDRLIVDMGFIEDKVPDEVPSYGWGYSNLRIEAFD